MAEPTQGFDIEITRQGNVIQQVQAKSHNDPAKLAKAVSDPKFDGTDPARSQRTRATKHPRRYALKREATQVGREAVMTGGYAAVAGAVLGGAMSTIRNAYAYSQGRIGGKEATKNIAGDAAESGVRSGGRGHAYADNSRLPAVLNETGRTHRYRHFA